MRSLLAALALVIFLGACASVPEQPPEPVIPPDAAEPATPEAPVLDPTEEAYESISLAMSLGDPEEAIAAYQDAELEDPDAPATRILLANLYAAAGDPESARSILEEVLAEDPENGDALYMLALIEGGSGNESREEELLRRAVDAQPDNASARAALGELELRRRRFRQAEEAFAASLESDPANLVALIGLGNVKLRTDEPEEAREVLSRAIEEAPNYSFGWSDRSRAHAMLYELEAAEADLDRAVELDEDFVWHRYDRGLVRLEQNDGAGAVEDFTAVIDREPDIFLAWVHRARGYDRLDMREEAIADYERALELRPDYHPGFVPLGMLYFEEERYPEAAEFFRKAWEEGNPNDPRDPGNAMLSALSLKLAGETAAAERFLTRVSADFPRPGLWYDMARFYIRPGFDGGILRDIRDEEDIILRTRMQFYLGGQYEALGQINSARALYLEVRDSEIRGFAETRLARHRYERMVPVD
jgi:FimV-like protein